MTLHDAICALLDEYQLEEFVDVIRDEAREDSTFDGISWEHPRVQRFREICQVLRAAQMTRD